MINDVTTDFAQPPQFQAIAAQRKGVDYSYPAEFRKEQEQIHSEIAPLLLPGAVAHEVYAHVESLAKRQSRWKIVQSNSQEMVLEATVITRILRFKDDVVIEVRSTGDQGVEVHMRSKSRVGRSDLGANAQRIKTFMTQLQQLTSAVGKHK